MKRLLTLAAGLAAVGLTLAPASASATSNENHVSTWCSAGIKYDNLSGQTFTIPAPPSGYEWTKLVLNGGQDGAPRGNVRSYVVDPVPAVGTVVTRPGAAVSNAILCKKKTETPPTTEPPSTTAPPTTEPPTTTTPPETTEPPPVTTEPPVETTQPPATTEPPTETTSPPVVETSAPTPPAPSSPPPAPTTPTPTQLPETGSELTLAAIAAVLLALGAGAVRMARR